MGFPPQSSILIGFSIFNHPFWGKTPYFWNPRVTSQEQRQRRLRLPGPQQIRVNQLTILEGTVVEIYHLWVFIGFHTSFNMGWFIPLFTGFGIHPNRWLGCLGFLVAINVVSWRIFFSRKESRWKCRGGQRCCSFADCHPGQEGRNCEWASSWVGWVAIEVM